MTPEYAKAIRMMGLEQLRESLTKMKEGE